MICDRHPLLLYHRIVFDEGPHTYAIYTTQKEDEEVTEENIDRNRLLPCIGVNSLIEHFFAPFDADAVAQQAARKKGCSPEDLKREWKIKNELAIELGHKVHENQEAMLKGQPPPHKPDDDFTKGVMSAGWQAIQDLKAAGWNPIYVEKMLFSPSLNVAGTVDAVFARKGGYLIVDWKTNQKLDFTGRFGKRALPPISHMPDCNGTHYRLQLALYRRLLTRESYITGVGNINHVICYLTPFGYIAYPQEDALEADSILLEYKTKAVWEEPPF